MINVILQRNSFDDADSVSILLPCSRWDYLTAKVQMGNTDFTKRALMEFEAPPELPEVELILNKMEPGPNFWTKHACAFDRYFYYEDLNPHIKERYDAQRLPPVSPKTWVFKVTAFNPTHHAN